MTTMIERPRAIEGTAPEGFDDLVRTVEELDVPGYKAEVIGGSIIMSPFSRAYYARAMMHLRERLTPHLPEGHGVHEAPFLFTFPQAKHAVAPDLHVADDAAFEHTDQHVDGAALSLVAELTSVSTRGRDWHEKLTVYGRQVPVYLLLDMQVEEITVFSEPSENGYQAHRTVRFGKALWIPEPFGFELDTTDFGKPRPRPAKADSED